VAGVVTAKRGYCTVAGSLHLCYASIVRALLPLLFLALVACGNDKLVDTDEVFFSWNQNRSLCGISLDERLDVSMTDLRQALDRAQERGEVLVLYAHEIGGGVSRQRLSAFLDEVSSRGLPFYTFPELADPPPDQRGGVALTFDDAYVDSWHEARDLFATHGARATFFVTRFFRLNDERIAKLHELESDGHAIESHGVNHVNAADYAESFGARTYVEDELVPSLDAMRSEGFSPTAFAYPFGARTGELDRELLEHVEVVRSISWLFARNGLLNDPCRE